MLTKVFFDAHQLLNVQTRLCKIMQTKIFFDADRPLKVQTRISKMHTFFFLKQTRISCDADHADQLFRKCRPDLIKIMMTKIFFDADQLLKVQTRISKMQTRIYCDADHADQFFSKMQTRL